MGNINCFEIFSDDRILCATVSASVSVNCASTNTASSLPDIITEATPKLSSDALNISGLNGPA
ncbi:hypothetical protein [Chryseobacterium endophyticum]|uniref:Uncharacterized protein n=1 Tax=Chryseobacterium endophyticum TaxID=1854762 RepID=A0AAU6WNI1_9FLAO|nr:hypothetical protein [uncultured Chryseobacterium sp.]